MATQLLVLDEAIAILEHAGARRDLVTRFRERAEAVLGAKPRTAVDDVTVCSGFGTKSGVGFVELTINDTGTQMTAKKAREVGLFLLEAAEAAASDEMFVRLLEHLGLDDHEAHARILLDLREIRQGTRGTSRPT